jgi:hypothetical protein
MVGAASAQHLAAPVPAPLTSPIGAIQNALLIAPPVQADRIHFSAPMSPLASVEQLAYYEDNGTVSFWPTSDTLLDSTGAPLLSPTDAPYVRLMNLERFTTALESPVLDSIRVAFYVDTILPGSHLVISIMNQELLLGSDGNEYPYPNLNAQLKSYNISRTNLHKGVVDTVIKIKNGLPIDMSDTLGNSKGSFFIGLSSYALGGNKIFAIADSANVPTDEARALDPEVDRFYWLALSADQKFFTRGFWGGRFTDQSQTGVFYTNFIMDAFLHDANASVGQENATAGFALGQNYPNAVSNETTIRYSLATSGPTTLKVYNAVGQEVATVVNESQPAGPHSVSFDAANLANGTYFYSLHSGSNVATRTMTIQK